MEITQLTLSAWSLAYAQAIAANDAALAALAYKRYLRAVQLSQI
jgi:hypothetical protein